MYSVLEKYNGKTRMAAGDDKQRTMMIDKLPPYLIICVKRFVRNNFFKEKNRTIIVFPIKNLQLKDFLTDAELENVLNTKYDLLANIRHEGRKKEDDEYSVNLSNKATGMWYHIRDLDVEEIAPQLMSVTEAYIQIYEKKQSKGEVVLSSKKEEKDHKSESLDVKME